MRPVRASGAERHDGVGVAQGDVGRDAGLGSAWTAPGQGTGPMLRSGTPGLVWQDLAAWAAAVEMTRDAALGAVPARNGRRAGQPVRPRDISHGRARRAVIAAIRAGRTGFEALTTEIARYRVIVDRNRHRGWEAPRTATTGLPVHFRCRQADDLTSEIVPVLATLSWPLRSWLAAIVWVQSGSPTTRSAPGWHGTLSSVSAGP